MKLTANQGFVNAKVVTGSWGEGPALSDWAAGFLGPALEKGMRNIGGGYVSSSELLRENYPNMWVVVVSQWLFRINNGKLAQV